MRDAVVRLQEADGTWQTLSADRAVGITAESLQLTSNAYGPDTCTFELHRDPSAAWPDLSSFTPVEVEVGNQLCWSGRIAETQVQDGSTRQLSVRCEGWQYHLDDDQINKTYVNRNLGEWKPISDYAPVGDEWVGHQGTVEINDGNIWMGWASNTKPKSGQLLGIVFDLGASDSSTGTSMALTGSVYQEAARYASTVTTANASNFLTNFQGVSSSYSIANWSSGTAYALGVIVCDTSSAGANCFYRSNKAIAVASRAISPVSNPTDWDEYTAPLALYAVGAANKTELANIAALSSSSIASTYSYQWGVNTRNPTAHYGVYQDGWGLMSHATSGPAVVKNMSLLVTGSAKSMRFIVLIMMMNNTASAAVANPYGIKLTSASVFSDSAYANNHSAALANPYYASISDTTTSVLKASNAVSNAVISGAPLLSSAKVQTTSTSLQDFKTDGYRTPRQVIDQANAYHGWVAKVDESKAMVFKPQPTAPIYEAGAWSGYEFTDQASSSGDDIYSRVIVDAEGPATPLRVARSAAQLATSAAISASGASTLTGSQQTNIQVTSLPAAQNQLLAVNGSVAAYEDWTLATISSNTDAAWNGLTYNLLGLLNVFASGTFRAGVTYEIRGSCQYQGNFPTGAQSMVMRFGADGVVTGTAIRTATGAAATVTTSGNAASLTLTANDTKAYLFRFFWTPTTDQSFVTSGTISSNATLPAFLIGLSTGLLNNGDRLCVGVYATIGGDATGQQDLSLHTRSATLAERHNIRRTFQLNVPGTQTTATLAAIGDAWLYNKLRAQFRGNAVFTGGSSIRQASTGDNVHPSRLLLSAGEVIRLTDRIDPDTGDIGRDARIASISYDHDAEQVTLELDNRRDNLQTFLNRLAS